MSKSYTPEPGTVPAKAVEYFDLNPEAEVATKDLVGLLGIPIKNISGALAKAVQAGLLAVRRQGRSCCYRKGNGVPMERPAAAPAADAPRGVLQQGEFTCCLYNDGELFLAGAQVTDDGMLLNAAQTAELREYLLHTGSLIEHLQQRTATPTEGAQP